MSDTPNAQPTNDTPKGGTSTAPWIKEVGFADSKLAASQPQSGVRDDLGRATGENPRTFNAADEVVRSGLDPAGAEARALAETEGELRAEWGDRYDQKVFQALYASAELNKISGGEAHKFLNATGLGDSAAGIMFMSAVADVLVSGPLAYVTDARSAARYMDAMMDGKLSEFLRGSGLADDPRTEKVFDHVAKLLRTGVSGSNPASIRRELDTILDDHQHPYYHRENREAHEAAVRQVNALYARLHG